MISGSSAATADITSRARGVQAVGAGVVGRREQHGTGAVDHTRAVAGVVDVVRVRRPGTSASISWAIVSSVCSNEKSTIFGKLGARAARPFGRGRRARVLLVVEGDRAVVVDDRDEAPIEATLRQGDGGPALALEAERIALLAGPPVERGDQVGRQPLGDLGIGGQEVFVVGVEPVGAVACRAAHRLDAGADHELLMAGADAHGGERHRLLAGPAEAVERHAGDGDRPSGVEHRHATDVVGVIAGVRAVAAHHVIDVDGVEADAVAQAVEHLAEHLLRMKVGEAALALLAHAARRTHRIDDPGRVGCGRVGVPHRMCRSCRCSIREVRTWGSEMD